MQSDANGYFALIIRTETFQSSRSECRGDKIMKYIQLKDKRRKTSAKDNSIITWIDNSQTKAA